MATIVDLLKKLEGVTVKEAATGSVYVYYGEKRVRVSDHEPNYGAPNREVDKCFYTRDACNCYADIYAVVEDVAEYLEIEIKGTLKGMMTKHFKRRALMAMDAARRAAEHRAFMEEVRAQHKAELEKIEAILQDNKAVVCKMIADAEAYGDLGANGNKRRKRTKSFFSKAFVSAFGFDARLYDVREVLSNNN